MIRRFLAGAAVLTLAGSAGAGVAAAAPRPAYDVICAAGVQTTIDYSRAKLDSITLEWFAADGAAPLAPLTLPIVPHPPKGFIAASTPASAVSVHVSFQHADGSGGDDVTVACS